MAIWRLLLLHLLPGALATLVFVLLAGSVEAAGYPPLAALLIAIAVVIIPFELGVVFIAGRGEPGLLSAIPYRDRMAARDWVILVPVLVVAGILGFGLLGVAEQPIRDTLFEWLPDWYLNPLPSDLGDILKRFKQVLVPELNLGQLRSIIRDKYLIDAIGLNKVQGKPFSVAEVEAKIEEFVTGRRPQTTYHAAVKPAAVLVASADGGG